MIKSREIVGDKVVVVDKNDNTSLRSLDNNVDEVLQMENDIESVNNEIGLFSSLVDDYYGIEYLKKLGIFGTFLSIILAPVVVLLINSYYGLNNPLIVATLLTCLGALPSGIFYVEGVKGTKEKSYFQAKLEALESIKSELEKKLSELKVNNNYKDIDTSNLKNIKFFKENSDELEKRYARIDDSIVNNNDKPKVLGLKKSSK
jgi:ABC-type multidrug transport system fused ATPase/permease subunit